MTTNANGNGSGLGVAEQIVHILGGRLRLVTRNEAAVFQIHLPSRIANPA